MIVVCKKYNDMYCYYRPLFFATKVPATSEAATTFQLEQVTASNEHHVAIRSKSRYVNQLEKIIDHKPKLLFVASSEIELTGYYVIFYFVIIICYIIGHSQLANHHLDKIKHSNEPAYDIVVSCLCNFIGCPKNVSHYGTNYTTKPTSCHTFWFIQALHRLSVQNCTSFYD